MSLEKAPMEIIVVENAMTYVQDNAQEKAGLTIRSHRYQTICDLRFFEMLCFPLRRPLKSRQRGPLRVLRRGMGDPSPENNTQDCAASLAPPLTLLP